MAESPEAGMRLAIYARVSTDEQREGQNIDSQIAELERFSRDKGWPIVETYKDDGWSGGVMERPELDRLRDDAQKGVFEAVLINDVDRLARDVAHLGVIKRDLEKKGIRVIFRKLPSDASPTYNLMVNILGSFAEFEREMIADRTRRGRRHKVEVRKQYLGGNTAYGYRYTPKDRLLGTEGILDVNPTEAAVVAQMFGWIDEEGLSARRVVRRLNEMRVPPKLGAPLWAKSSVLRILRSEIYAGVWHYNKFQGCEPKHPSPIQRYRKHGKGSLRKRPKNEWLPLVLPDALRIVPRDRWERVQQRLDRNITFSPRNEKHSYLLKGLVRCGACGARYVGDPCHGKFYYRCLARCKGMPSVTERLLDDAVMAAVREAVVKPEVILKPLRQLQSAEMRERREHAQAAKSAEAVLARLKAEEERVLEAYRTGVITPAQLGQQLETVKARRSELESHAREAQQESTVPGGDADRAVSAYCAEAASNLASFTHERWQEFLRTIIDNIIFRGNQITIQGRIPAGGTAAQIRLESPVLRELRGLRPAR
jgi:site-specific DNA recombinase